MKKSNPNREIESTNGENIDSESSNDKEIGEMKEPIVEEKQEITIGDFIETSTEQISDLVEEINATSVRETPATEVVEHVFENGNSKKVDPLDNFSKLSTEDKLQQIFLSLLSLTNEVKELKQILNDKQ